MIRAENTDPRPGTISDREATAIKDFTADHEFDATTTTSQTGLSLLILGR